MSNAPTAPFFDYHAHARVPGLRRRRALRLAGAATAATLLALPFLAIQPGDPGSAAALAPLPSVRLLGGTQGESMPGELTPPGFAINAAKPFVPTYGDAASALRAERCLTEAIYYEGALEPERGQRAIAQVVLNRVRHPAYPDTVCGVVFQGSERATGRQFTFTCDGSRARAPVPSLWQRANRIAKAALGGAVEPEVGLATHYHADYVNPYWSASLDAAGQIGRHMFYRWKGGAGEAGAFTMRYAGREPLIGAWTPRPVAPAAAAVSASDPAALGPASRPGAPLGQFVPAPGGAVLPAAPAPAPFRARPLMLAPKPVAKPVGDAAAPAGDGPA